MYTYNYIPETNAGSTDDEASYYQSMKGQCHLEKSIASVRNRLQCATHCAVDDQCLAYNYVKDTSECRTTTTLDEGNKDCYLKPVWHNSLKLFYKKKYIANYKILLYCSFLFYESLKYSLLYLHKHWEIILSEILLNYQRNSINN